MATQRERKITVGRGQGVERCLVIQGPALRQVSGEKKAGDSGLRELWDLSKITLALAGHIDGIAFDVL